MSIIKVDYGTVGGGYELENNATGTPVSSLNFSGKAGKKLVLTICMAWNVNMDNAYAQIATISGGTITNTHLLNGASTSGNNAYYTMRTYEIDVTSDTLAITLTKSSVSYSAVFI